MIASLRGTVQYRGTDHLIIDVHGVGYEVFVPESTLLQLDEQQEAFLHIHTHVREDALLLFGFLTMADKESYQLLLSVSGVGPKLAMAIIATLTPGELARAITAEDIGRLTQVSGVGKKTAKRLCLDLKDKVDFIPELPAPDSPATQAPQGTDQHPAQNDCISALVNLGYSLGDAEEAVLTAADQLGEEAGLEELLRHALRSLA